MNGILSDIEFIGFIGFICGFEVNFRDDKLGLEGTMALIEKKLGLII